MVETIRYRFTVRGGTAAALEARNEIPLARELVVETDTGKLKLGDGETRYNDLEYISGTIDFAIRVHEGWIQYSVDGEETWGDVIALEELKGEPGASSGQFMFGAGDRAQPLPIGEKGLVPVTFSGTIESMQLVIVTSDGEPGSVEVDLRRCSLNDFGAGRPGPGDSITAGSRPAISSGLKTSDSDLLGWNRRFQAGDVFVPVVLGRSSNVTHFALALRTEKDT